MLDKTSAEYKKIKKLYAQGKITENDYNRLLAALENYGSDETAAGESSDEEANKTVGQMLRELGIKISSSVKSGWDAANKAVDSVGDTLRGAVRGVACMVADSLADDGQEKDPCRSDEQYLIPYEKMYIRLNYIGEKPAEIKTKVKRQASLCKKCKKIMSPELSETVNALLDERFIGKYERSTGDEYLRLVIRPKDSI